MKISQALPQFMHEKALFVVTGEKDAVFYVAQNGILEKQDRFISRDPQYSDHEGVYYAASRINGMIHTASVREIDQRRIRRAFLLEFRAHLRRILKENFSSIYLFTPLHMNDMILHVFPTSSLRLIRSVVNGNYFSQHPFCLLQLAAFHGQGTIKE